MFLKIDFSVETLSIIVCILSFKNIKYIKNSYVYNWTDPFGFKIKFKCKIDRKQLIIFCFTK